MPTIEDATATLLRSLGAMELPSVAVLGCAHADLSWVPATAVGIRLPECFGALGFGFPAQLLASGIGEVQVVDCPQDASLAGRLAAEWSLVLDDIARYQPPARRWFRGTGGPIIDLTQSGPAFARRFAFGLRAGRPPVLDPTLDDTGRTVAALRLLREQGRARNEADCASAADSGAAVPAAVSLSAADCVVCGVCVRACPQHALELTSAGGVTTLTHHPDRCRADLGCVRLCPSQALTLVSRLTVGDLAGAQASELAQLETTICLRCNAVHPASDGLLCRTCAARSATGFGALPTLQPRTS